MEGDKKTAGSYSISSDLFGVKDSFSSWVNANSSSSTRIFDSVFSAPLTVVGKDPSHSEVIGSWRMQNSELLVSKAKNGSPGNISQSSGVQSYIVPSKDKSSIFQETVEPCSLSSSLYYGGQDIYSTTPNTQASGSILIKDEGEHDSNENNINCASRGNWWQGSLYY